MPGFTAVPVASTLWTKEIVSCKCIYLGSQDAIPLAHHALVSGTPVMQGVFLKGMAWTCNNYPLLRRESYTWRENRNSAYPGIRKKYMKLLLERFGKPEYNLEYTPGTDPELHLFRMDLMRCRLLCTGSTFPYMIVGMTDAPPLQGIVSLCVGSGHKLVMDVVSSILRMKMSKVARWYSFDETMCV